MYLNLCITLGEGDDILEEAGDRDGADTPRGRLHRTDLCICIRIREGDKVGVKIVELFLF